MCMKIGEFVQCMGISIEIICFYEVQGLLFLVVCVVNNYCVYIFEYVEQLVFIVKCWLFDMVYMEICCLFELQVNLQVLCEEINNLLDEYLCYVEVCIVELNDFKGQIEVIGQCCMMVVLVVECGVL